MRISFTFKPRLRAFCGTRLPPATHYLGGEPRWDRTRWVFTFQLLRFDPAQGRWFKYETDSDDEYPRWSAVTNPKWVDAAKPLGSLKLRSVEVIP